MKSLFVLLFAFALSSTAQAQISRDTVVRTYAQKVYQQYAAALQGARDIQASIDTFLKNPSEENLAAAKITWTQARKLYSVTEIYRFYGGPIDGEEGPEGKVNAWPLDEVYIDSIIERRDLYPDLTAEVLTDLNEKDGEKNISTGYHAIEYMLWGQDLSATGPGARPAADFSSSPLADRRALYLREVSALLVSDLEWILNQWDINVANNYAQRFVADTDVSLTNMLTAIVKMAGGELSQERMFVALDTRQQEEEHSCFSDTTHFDILYNFLGIKVVLEDGVLDLIRQSDATTADEIAAQLALTEKTLRAIPAPFDQAILDDAGRAKVMDGIVALETLTEAVRQGGFSIGIELP